ncbi:MAG: histidine phosphatase family protein, partial [Oscillospiraceae bacterium]|nr:histidine phosphatase family protein [Oscillospiraceae bacterium]
VCRYGGGESMMQVAHRVYSLLDEVTTDPTRTVLLAAHNGIARVVNSYFFEMTNEEYAAFAVKNCQELEYEF